MRKLISTEIGTLPEDWRVAPISEVADYVTDYVANGSFALLKKNVTYKSEPDYAILIRLTDFSRNFGGDFVYVDEHSYHFLKKSQLQGGEIVVSNIGEYAGTVFRVPHLGRPMTLGPNALMMSFGTHNDFYFYWFRSPNGQEILRSLRTGSAVPKFNKTDFRNSKVPVPPSGEQKAIAEVLSSLDDKIDLLHRQNKTLESLAQTLFRQWFIEEADDSWETATLGELFEIGIGRTPPRKEQHWFSTNPSDIKWISIKDMGNCGVYIDSTAEYLTAEAVEQFNVPIIPANTLLLSFKMTLGRLAITTETMLSNEAIAHFKHKDGSRIFPEFLYLFLKSYKFELLGSTSSIVEAINSQMIKEMEMVVPDNATLGKFKESIKPIFSKIRGNSIQIETLIRLRDSLLPKLMSGEILVNNDHG